MTGNRQFSISGSLFAGRKDMKAQSVWAQTIPVSSAMSVILSAMIPAVTSQPIAVVHQVFTADPMSFFREVSHTRGTSANGIPKERIT